jgi:hypothetical protein
MTRAVKLDALKQNTVLTLVSVGISQRQAALQVGCDPSTVTKLAARDEAFAEQLLASQRSSVQSRLEQVQRHGEKSWRAAAWLLEKCHPHLYGKNAGNVDQRALEEQRQQMIMILGQEIGDAELLDRIIDRLHELDEPHETTVADAAPAKITSEKPALAADTAPQANAPTSDTQSSQQQEEQQQQRHEEQQQQQRKASMNQILAVAAQLATPTAPSPDQASKPAMKIDVECYRARDSLSGYGNTQACAPPGACAGKTPAARHIPHSQRLALKRLERARRKGRRR